MPLAVARKTAPSAAAAGAGRRVGPLEKQTRRYQNHDTGASRHGARAGQNPKRNERSRGASAAHAFAGRQAQPDIGLHLGGQPVPGDGRQFIERDQVVARAMRTPATRRGTRGNGPQ